MQETTKFVVPSFFLPYTFLFPCYLMFIYFNFFFLWIYDSVYVHDESEAIVLAMFEREAMGLLQISAKKFVDKHTQVYLVKMFLYVK